MKSLNNTKTKVLHYNYYILSLNGAICQSQAEIYFRFTSLGHHQTSVTGALARKKKSLAI